MTGQPGRRSSESSVTAGTGARADRYPHPTSDAVTAAMKGNRKRDTRPELALRSALHRAGLRFRCDYPIEVLDRRPIRVDVVFTRPRIAVFLDGCFWHSCPAHSNTPRANQSYWKPKLARNVERDIETDAALAAVGWTPVRVWEHEEPHLAAARVRRIVASATGQ
jgi:DNA mismatch endonuclease (patch repair protein)